MMFVLLNAYCLKFHRFSYSLEQREGRNTISVRFPIKIAELTSNITDFLNGSHPDVFSLGI